MTEGQTPAGWYDDGQGQLRWYDGTAWTEHVQPLPAPAAPPVPEQPVQAQPVAQPAAQAPVPQAPAAQAAPAAAAGTAIGTPGSHGQGDPWAEPTPFYRKSWFLIVLALVVLAIIGGIFALSGGGDDDATAPVTSATTAATAAPTAATTAAGTSGVGADAATVAAAAGCTVSATIPPTATGTGPAPKSKVGCTLNGVDYTVVTWNSVADQTAEGALAKAFSQPVTAGTKYYVAGNGFTAFDTTYSQAAATTFAATPAGGTVKGVVVVLASGAPTP